ncbi:MAG: sigma-70 family RNA polymerase sigma factor [Rickettsiales bacterium]|jgi:RNA polymerase sigma-70 factor (ECF subfamily)|nr:sigma-70 family RNA polymerase sigma factor [Rickettsiales bacterium]
MVASENKYAEISALMLAGLDGDQAAYGKFLSTIAPMLRRMVSRKLSQPDVEDVVQEILISIHKARHTYDGKRPIMPWLYSIATFRITDHLRKHYSQMRHQSVDIADFENILSDVTEEASNHESIEELLENVPEKHKRILTLMHVEGYTAKEVGKKMGMNESAVKVAAHRAIKKIRGKFGT